MHAVSGASEPDSEWPRLRGPRPGAAHGGCVPGRCGAVNQVVADALVKAYSGGLNKEDCDKLNADDAAEVARELIKHSKQLRGVATEQKAVR